MYLNILIKEIFKYFQILKLNSDFKIEFDNITQRKSILFTVSSNYFIKKSKTFEFWRKSYLKQFTKRFFHYITDYNSS